jgi:hypothetical protein
MKHLLTSAAVIAALAISAPVSAQMANPSGGAPTTPYSTNTPPPAPTPPSGRMPSGGRKLSGSNYIPSAAPPPDTTSETPPAHRHARVHHTMHGHMAHGHMAHGPQSVTDTAAQLNQAELSRLQAGGPPAGASMPPPRASQMAPPPPSTSGGNSMGMPGPNTGGPGLTPYSGGPPQR